MKYVVCYDSSYLRDTQAYCGPFGDGHAWGDDTNWKDFSGPAFCGVYEAESEEEAIEKAHAGSGLCKEAFYVACEIG